MKSKYKRARKSDIYNESRKKCFYLNEHRQLKIPPQSYKIQKAQKLSLWQKVGDCISDFIRYLMWRFEDILRGLIYNISDFVEFLKTGKYPELTVMELWCRKDPNDIGYEIGEDEILSLEGYIPPKKSLNHKK